MNLGGGGGSLDTRKIDIGLSGGIRDSYKLRWCSGLILARKEQEGKSWEPVELSTRVQIPAGAPTLQDGPVAQHGRASGFYLLGRNQSVAGSNPVGPMSEEKPDVKHSLSCERTLKVMRERDNLMHHSFRESDVPGVPTTSSRVADLMARDLEKVDRIWRC